MREPILFGYIMAAGLSGWWLRSRGVIDALVKAAGGPLLPSRNTLDGALWAGLPAAAAGGVLACTITNSAGAATLCQMAALALWAGAIALLALTDHYSRVLPTRLVRAATVGAASLLLAEGAFSGSWHLVARGAGCAALAGATFGLWALFSPRGLGFGDVRLAVLVALGAGASSVPGALVALSLSPLVAGLSSKCRSHRAGEPKPVALGPFLAVAGIVTVVSSAF